MENDFPLMLGLQEPDVWNPDGISQALSQGMRPTSISIQQAKKTLLPTSTLEEIKKRQLASFRDQAAGISALESDLQNRQAGGVNPLLAISSGLSDMFAGTNRLEGLTRQKQMQMSKADQDKYRLQDMKKDLTKAEIAMFESQFQNEDEVRKMQMQENQLDKKLAAEQKIAAMKLAADEKGKLLPGQEAADKAFGKEYQDWNAQGGYAGVEKQLMMLENAANKLEQNPSLSGGASTILPDVIRRRVSPDAMTIEQDVRQATQAALRQTLGSQFTEREGEAIMQRSYDPALPAAENIKKIRAAVQELKTKAVEKDRASKFFEQTGGTLKGLAATENRPVIATTDKMKRLEELRKKAGK